MQQSQPTQVALSGGAQLQSNATQTGATTGRAQKKASKPHRKVLTSLILEILIYVGALWSAFYYVFNILSYIYKGTYS